MKWPEPLRRLLRWRPLHTLLILLLGVLLGRWSASVGGTDLDDLDEEQAQLAAAECPERLAGLERDRRQLREELAYLKQSVVVEQEACNGVRETLFEKEAAIGKMTEQLAFYRGIFAPAEQVGGIQVYKLEVDPVSGRHYQFRVTILQPARQSSAAEGTLILEFVGLGADGQPQRLGLDKLIRGEPFSGDYAFRYYTELYGQFRLPEQWTPLRIEAKVRPKGRRKALLAETYVWKDLMAARSAQESGR